MITVLSVLQRRGMIGGNVVVGVTTYLGTLFEGKRLRGTSLRP
jgi:hypothetical protein